MKDLMVRPLCSALEISKRENGESEAGLGVRAEEADQDEVRGQTDGEEHAGEEEKQELQPATFGGCDSTAGDKSTSSGRHTSHDQGD